MIYYVQYRTYMDYSNETQRKTQEIAPVKSSATCIQLPKGKPDTIDRMAEESKEVVPRRHRPVVQRRGHHVPGLQAEPREQGRQKLDNQ